MMLHDAYAALARIGLVKNHTDFSKDFLNKGNRYYDHLICSRKPPAVAALVSLYVRLRAIADSLARVNVAAAPEIDDLTRAAWDEVERRSCSVLPPRHKRPAWMHAQR